MSTDTTRIKIQLPGVRLSYAHLAVPRGFGKKGTGDKKFQATFLLDKEIHKETIAGVMDAVRTLAKASWGDNVKGVKHCLRDGSEKADMDGYGEGVKFIAASCHVEKRPTVVDGRRNPVSQGDKAFPFSGCYVNGLINLWVQDNEFGKKINAGLLAVQFVRPGPAFSDSSIDVEKEFDVIDDPQATGSGDGMFEDEFV